MKCAVILHRETTVLTRDVKCASHQPLLPNQGMAGRSSAHLLVWKEQPAATSQESTWVVPVVTRWREGSWIFLSLQLHDTTDTSHHIYIMEPYIHHHHWALVLPFFLSSFFLFTLYISLYHGKDWKLDCIIPTACLSAIIAQGAKDQVKNNRSQLLTQLLHT